MTDIELIDRLRSVDRVFATEAADRIEALKCENAAIEKRLQEIQRMCLGYQEEHAGLRKDAERYRWLRDQNADLEAGFYVGDETDALPGDIDWVGSDLDVAIDRAMKEQT